MIFDFLLSEYCLGYHQDKSVRALDPSNLCDAPRGLSGTEVNALGLACALAEMEHSVRVYTHIVPREGAAHTVTFHDIRCSMTTTERADVVVAFHDSTPLGWWPGGLRVVWHQTLRPPFLERLGHEPVDLYISSTQRNAAHLSQWTGSVPWRVVPNGWDFGTISYDAPVPGRIFYHTSPERGLHVLLEALPQIKARLPEAHLVVYSRLELAREPHKARWQLIAQGLERCAGYVEVHEHGASRNTVLRALAKAAAVAYPSEPPMPCEVMPVSILEALGLGVPVVTAPSDGFEEAFGDTLILSPSPPSQYLPEFVHNVCRVLADEQSQVEAVAHGMAWAQQYRFRSTALRFLDVTLAAMADKEAGACLRG